MFFTLESCMLLPNRLIFGSVLIKKIISEFLIENYAILTGNSITLLICLENHEYHNFTKFFKKSHVYMESMLKSMRQLNLQHQSQLILY